MKSWYKLRYELSPAQSRYCKLLEKSFNVPDPLGNPIPYIMTDYQKEFHSQSFNVQRDKAFHLLFIKARGISFSTSSLIDIIMTAATFSNQVIPIIAQREDGAYDLLNVGKWLIRNCNLNELKNETEFSDSSSEIFFKTTGSTIKIYPSSSAADAIRGRRLIRALVDEYAFQQNDKALWAAVENCMQSGVGQVLVGSTPNGRTNQFHDFVQLAREKGTQVGFYLFELPVFDPSQFDPKAPIPSQDLIPIAPWINLTKLEQKRQLDLQIFLQEQMCDFLDESIAFIPYATIMKCSKEMFNYKKMLYDQPEYTFETPNRIIIGSDVAEKKDYFSVAVYEEIIEPETGKVYYFQRYLDYFNGLNIPQLEEYMNKLFELFPSFDVCRLDSTGLGTGLVGYLKKKWGHRIEGINFSSTVFIGDGKQKAPIRQVMITNLKRLMENGQVFLIQDKTQVAHINSIDYGFKVPENRGAGHADILFANALALLKSKYSVFSNDLVTTTLKDNSIPSDPTKMDIIQRFNYYKKQSKR